ncbi:MAG TPA: MFS transporter [Bacteroidota bacterium]|nr:MFS transporter [Bacteroidota bacterium]
MTDKKPSVVEFLGLKRDLIGLLSMVILVGLGEHMAERFLPLYLVALGGGALSVGLLNALDNLLGALYAFPGGFLSDKIGYKRALLVFNLLAMSGYAIAIVTPSWQTVILGAILFTSWSAISLPATMDLVASVLPREKRTMGVSLHSMVRRIPMALGPVIGGALIGAFGETRGVRIALVIAFLFAGVSLVVQQVMIGKETTRPSDGKTRRSYGWRLLSADLRKLLVSDVLIRFCEQIPYAFVVIWCVKVNGVSALQFGLLTTIEMVTAMLIYVPVAYLADRSTKKPFVVVTFMFFTLFPLVLLVSRSFWAMAVAFFIRGLKEFGEPTRKALIMDLAPDGQKAATFGVYYLIRDTIVSFAAFGGALLWDGSTIETLVGMTGVGQQLVPLFQSFVSPTANLLTAFGFGVAGTIYFALFGKDLGRSAHELVSEKSNQ